MANSKAESFDSWVPELHACQGLNTCKGHGANGTGTTAGDGECATTAVHTCGGGNDCRGQGGCGYSNDPGDNACKGLGGCGTPIPTRQVFHGEGSLAGSSVWDYARKVFELRIEKTNLRRADKIEVAPSGRPTPSRQNAPAT